MILLHRLTPFAIFFLSAVGFGCMLFSPFTLGSWALASFALVILLFARLLLWDVRRTGFWVFLGIPCFLIVTSLAFFLLLEHDAPKWILSGLVSLGLGLFAENVFAFYHYPRAYQAYSLEYLSLTLGVCGIFFTASATSLAGLFLEAPLWMTAPSIAGISWAVLVAIFWVSKVSWEAGRVYALWGALLTTEIYAVGSWLPTGYLTHAGISAIFFGWYVGTMRAHAFQKYTPTVFAKATIFAGVLMAILLVTSSWR